MAKRDFKFDRALNRLEELVERLRVEELELDEALSLFEEGIKLSLECFKKLEESKAKVEFLIKQSEEAFKRIEASVETLAEKGTQISTELGLEKEETLELIDFSEEGESNEENKRFLKKTKKGPNLFEE